MKQTLLVKVVADPAQHVSLLRTLEAFNAACNWIAGIAFAQQCANKVELQKIVYYDVREHFGLSAQMAIRAISKVVEAYKRDRTIRPRFRAHGAMTYDERVRGQADLLYRNGTFYLAVTVDSPEPEPTEADDVLGVDLGIVNLATDSDGDTYSGEAVERTRRIYAHRRRNLQRKGTQSARRKLKTLAGRQARYQRNVNHLISKAVVRKAKGTGRGLAVENLGGIRSRTTVKRAQRARHANWSFFQLRSFIAYKATLAGVRVVAVDPRNSSRECAVCGHIDKANRPTQATFSCVLCGHAALADHNAARVLAARARAVVMQPMVPDASSDVAPGTSPSL